MSEEFRPIICGYQFEASSVFSSDHFLLAAGRMEEKMPLQDVLWTVSVTVRLTNGMHRSFHSLFDTLDFLEHEWPLKNSARHRKAVSSCRTALNTPSHADVSREDFIAACLEAGFPTISEQTGHLGGQNPVNAEADLTTGKPLRYHPMFRKP